MSSRNHPNELEDLGLRSSLKNWVASKEPPHNGRKQLLATAAQQKPFSSQNESKSNFGWSFRFFDRFSAISFYPLYGYPLETVSLRASMAIR